LDLRATETIAVLSPLMRSPLSTFSHSSLFMVKLTIEYFESCCTIFKRLKTEILVVECLEIILVAGKLAGV
jgi:hypothetical protein